MPQECGEKHDADILAICMLLYYLGAMVTRVRRLPSIPDRGPLVHREIWMLLWLADLVEAVDAEEETMP